MLSPSPLAHCESGADLLFIVVPLWMATDLATRKERRIRNERAIIGKTLHFPYSDRICRAYCWYRRITFFLWHSQYRDVVCIKSIAHFGRAPKFISVCRKYHVHKIMPLRCGMPGFCLLRICNYPVLQLEYEAPPRGTLKLHRWLNLGDMAVLGVCSLKRFVIAIAVSLPSSAGAIYRCQPIAMFHLALFENP